MKIRVALASLLMVGVAFVAPSAMASPSAVIDLTNQHRTANGVSYLCTNAGLNQMAQNWAQHMADTNNMYHNPNMADQAPNGWGFLGENVAYSGMGVTPPHVMTDMWMKSPGHRENMLKPEYTDIGVGWAADSKGGIYSAQVFAGYAGSSCSAPPAAPAPAPAPAPVKTKAPAPVPDPLVRDVQQLLHDVGYGNFAGRVDGFYGNMTKTAIKKFQSENGLEAVGNADESVKNALLEKKNAGWNRSVLFPAPAPAPEPAPVEAAPVEEAPVEEAPVEEAPVEEVVPVEVVPEPEPEVTPEVIEVTPEPTKTPEVKSSPTPDPTETVEQLKALKIGTVDDSNSGVSGGVIAGLVVALAGVLTGLGFAARKYLGRQK